MARRILVHRAYLGGVAAALAMTTGIARSEPPAATAATPAGTSPVTPRFGIFDDATTIATARRRVAVEPDAGRFRDNALTIANAWLARSDDWIRQIMPPPGSRFAIGKAGCPACGKAWADFGGGGLASLDRPLELKCPHCGMVFDLAHPSGPYADTGMGVVRNGRHYWLRGVWNAFITGEMWRAAGAGGSAIVALSDAYALTGDDRYARKLIVILDALATLSPTTKGIRDYVNSPDSDEGRLQLGDSGFFRAQPYSARAIDLLGNHPGLLEPSPTNPKIGAVRDNIRYGLFDEFLFKPIDVRGGKLSTLHNHEADSVRALLVDGLLWGNADYVRWAAADIQSFLDNTIDRDGQYYETSFNYTSFTRNLHMSLIEMLARYDPSRYPAEAHMPRREELPYGGNFFNHPALARLILESPSRLSVLGRPPSYGDVHHDETVRRASGRPYDANLYLHAQRYLHYATDPAIRARAAAVVAANEPFALAAKQKRNTSTYGWPLYFGIDEGEPKTVSAAALQAGLPEETHSDLYNLTGVAILRSGGDSSDRRAALLRAGMTMSHGHDDALGLFLYAQGRALSGDVGYGDTANHAYAGWNTRAIAHNTVVVNEDANRPPRFRIGPGGAVVRFFDGGDSGRADTGRSQVDAPAVARSVKAPGVSWFEAAHPALFPAADGIRDYRRAVFQIDLGPDAAYWIDIFDIDGGRTHDYSFHANPLGNTGSFTVEGAPLAGRSDAWTLAGLDPKWRSAAFNAPDRSWGERMSVSGVIPPIPGVADGVPASDLTWLPPPGNGYGFLYDLKAVTTDAPWSATWRWNEKDDRFGLRLTLLPEKPLLVTTSTGPNLTNEEKMRWGVARRAPPTGPEGVRTRFAAVIEAFGSKGPRVTGTSALRGPSGEIVGVRVMSAGGGEDILLDARRGGAPPSLAAAVESRRIDVETGITTAPDAGFCLVRRTASGLQSISLSEGGSGGIGTKEGIALRFTGGGAWQGAVTSANEAAGTFRTTPALPRCTAGGLLVVTNPACTHVSTYRVGEIHGDSGDIQPLNSGIVLGRARVAETMPDGFVSTSPLVYGRQYGVDTTYLTGKRIRIGSEDGHIAAMPEMKNIQLSGGGRGQPKVGDEFVISDVQPGDIVRMKGTASLTHDPSGVWTLRADLPVIVTFPMPMQMRIAGNDWRQMSGKSVSLTADDLAGGTVQFRPAVL